jgi:hypothetical protein
MASGKVPEGGGRGVSPADDEKSLNLNSILELQFHL